MSTSEYPAGFHAWPLGKRNEWYAHEAAKITARTRTLNSSNGEFAEAQSEPIIEMASDIKPEHIDWIWDGFLARRKIHLFAGAPETGKTTLALAYAAIISAGLYWPDRLAAAKIGKVLIWSNEDDISDTIIPRLIRMGADLSNIGFVKGQRDKNGKERPFNPSTDMPSLIAKAAAMGEVDLLILDPIVAAVPVSKNSHDNAQTRAGLQPVKDFAEAGCAVIGISHFTKGTAGQDPIERV